MKRLNYIDLGVHKGQEMDLVLEQYEKYEDKFDLIIYGVEAYKAHFEGLKNKYKNNNRVKLFNNAITHKTGFTNLYLSIGGSQLGNSLYSSKRHVNPKSKHSVFGYTFSEFVSKHVEDFESSVNVLKLNIEGAELAVYENLIENNMRKHIDLFCGLPGHDIEKVSELQIKRDRYYSIIKEHDIKLSYLCEANLLNSINIFEAVS